MCTKPLPLLDWQLLHVPWSPGYLEQTSAEVLPEVLQFIARASQVLSFCHRACAEADQQAAEAQERCTSLEAAAAAAEARTEALQHALESAEQDLQVEVQRWKLQAEAASRAAKLIDSRSSVSTAETAEQADSLRRQARPSCMTMAFVAQMHVLFVAACWTCIKEQVKAIWAQDNKNFSHFCHVETIFGTHISPLASEGALIFGLSCMVVFSLDRGAI